MLSSFTWTVDQTAPTVTITTATDGNGAAVAPGGTTTSNAITFAFSSPDADTASFACSTDGAAFIACTSPITYTGLGDGSHTFSVQAIDTSGNTGPVSSFTWTVDQTAPTVTITTATDGNGGSSSTRWNNNIT